MRVSSSPSPPLLDPPRPAIETAELSLCNLPIMRRLLHGYVQTPLEHRWRAQWRQLLCCSRQHPATTSIAGNNAVRDFMLRCEMRRVRVHRCCVAPGPLRSPCKRDPFSGTHGPSSCCRVDCGHDFKAFGSGLRISTPWFHSLIVVVLERG